MDRLSAVGDSGLRAALEFVRGQEQCVTADELAAHDAIHRNVARSRLERLASAGLLETGFTRAGAGRPAKTYRAAPELSAIEFPAHHYEELVGLLAEGRSDLREVGAAFGRRLAKAAGLPSRRNLDEEKIWRNVEEHGAELVLGRRVVSIDPDAHKAVDDAGDEYAYERLVLATGGTPRRLGGDDANVVYYRTLEDYRRVRALSDGG